MYFTLLRREDAPIGVASRNSHIVIEPLNRAACHYALAWRVAGVAGGGEHRTTLSTLSLAHIFS